MLRNHLDMIGRNEPIQKKAKFWQSYVRALKGTDDMRAPERISSRPRSLFHPLSSDFPEMGSWPYSKSIYDDPSTANERITVPGYRYQPVSRETYGYSPRNLYPRSAYYPSYDSNKPWADHLKRLADIDRFYPSKYPLSYRYGVGAPAPRRAVSAAPSEKAVAFNYAGTLGQTSIEVCVDRYIVLNGCVSRGGINTCNSFKRKTCVVAMSPSYSNCMMGQPIYTRGGITRRPLTELLEPLPSMPLSRITRDPWWWEYPELRPYSSPYTWPYTPFYLRDSYLSPVKRTYLWDKHPIRPFDYDSNNCSCWSSRLELTLRAATLHLPRDLLPIYFKAGMIGQSTYLEDLSLHPNSQTPVATRRKPANY
uniref:Myofilin n=1 Tax=Timema cristinae TaxID=61476 RepID=A0A7R9H2V1_TIMCR|nr:unnamed protein product [Timema cristinae]